MIYLLLIFGFISCTDNNSENNHQKLIRYTNHKACLEAVHNSALVLLPSLNYKMTEKEVHELFDFCKKKWGNENDN